MTNKPDLRWLITTIIHPNYRMPSGKKFVCCDDADSKTDQILALIKQAGYVQLAEDQSLPQNPFRDISFQQAVGWDVGKMDMLKAGFRRVKNE